jgi:pantetheine-phosphate adenylyltransferase
MTLRKAIYAASLDPITNGHINVIERMAPLYDELIVIVAVDSRKQYTFTQDERVAMARAATAHIANVTIDVCVGGYVVKKAAALGAGTIIRGLRNFKDLEDEQTLAAENRSICPDVETVWIPCLPTLMHVSSSMVKGHVGVDPDWATQVARSVPGIVVGKLQEKHMLTKAKKYWISLMATLGNPAGSEEVFINLVTRYTEPNRTYHNLAHIVAMLDELEASDVRNEALSLAIWFHDAVYETQTENHAKIASNEERSAHLAETNMREMGLDEGLIAQVIELIMATTHAALPVGELAQTLVDLDLMILGKPEPEFDAYDSAIRAEYAHVSDTDFSTGRRRALQSFLDRATHASIFSTLRFRTLYEDAARKNLERAIARL